MDEMKSKGPSWMKSNISRKFPSYRDSKIITVQGWLEGRRKDDDIGGLWRIHDTLYDLDDFIDRHPGGSFWLRETKGTDITEAFECHHLSKTPESMLATFKVRDADTPRNITLTMKEDGFYKTLKSRVREELKNIDFTPSKKSDYIHAGLLISTFLLAILTAHFRSYSLAFVCGLALCWTTIISHNYFHRRDNWRMYAMNLSLMNFNDWRVSHVLSHHFYANTFHDLELSMYEPFFNWVPSGEMKNVFQRYGSWVYGVLVYWIIFHLEIVKRLIHSIIKENVLYWDDLVGLTLPTAMVLTTSAGLMTSLKLWIFIVAASSFIFAVIGLNAAHHDPDILHDGDAPRVDTDWGLFQLDTIIDRRDLKGSQFLVLTHFGDHILHHLFPTLDHGVLPQLYPILNKTMEEFNGRLREYNHFQHMVGQHKQLARIEPNLIPPGSVKKEE